MVILDHLTCLLRSLYTGQEAEVRTRRGTTDWLKIGKGVHQVISRLYIVSCLFNLYAEYIIQNAGMDESQAEIKIARRNISNLRYANDTTIMAESEEELKALNEGKRGEWKSWLITLSKNEDHGIWSHHFMANRREWSGNVTDFVFLVSKITVDSDNSHEIKRHLLLGRKAMKNLDGVLKTRDNALQAKSQSYGSSGSHVRMWELDHNEGWVPKNRCFQIVLEKTLQSFLDSKEIKSVNPKGN